MTVIEVRDLAKRFGPAAAVDGLSFVVGAGTVTGFLGPNGAGKTTTLRMLVGLVTPTSGQVMIWGKPYRELGARRRRVGAVLEASGFHPGRTVADHLRVRCAALGAGRSRIGTVLAETGMGELAGRRAGSLSLGERQRLSLAGALLGEPDVLPGAHIDLICVGGRADDPMADQLGRQDRHTATRRAGLGGNPPPASLANPGRARLQGPVIRP